MTEIPKHLLQRANIAQARPAGSPTTSHAPAPKLPRTEPSNPFEDIPSSLSAQEREVLASSFFYSLTYGEPHDDLIAVKAVETFETLAGMIKVTEDPFQLACLVAMRSGLSTFLKLHRYSDSNYSEAAIQDVKSIWQRIGTLHDIEKDQLTSQLDTLSDLHLENIGLETHDDPDEAFAQVLLAGFFGLRTTIYVLKLLSLSDQEVASNSQLMNTFQKLSGLQRIISEIEEQLTPKELAEYLQQLAKVKVQYFNELIDGANSLSIALPDEKVPDCENIIMDLMYAGDLDSAYHKITASAFKEQMMTNLRVSGFVAKIIPVNPHVSRLEYGRPPVT